MRQRQNECLRAGKQDRGSRTATDPGRANPLVQSKTARHEPANARPPSYVKAWRGLHGADPCGRNGSGQPVSRGGPLKTVGRPHLAAALKVAVGRMGRPSPRVDVAPGRKALWCGVNPKPEG